MRCVYELQIEERFFDSLLIFPVPNPPYSVERCFNTKQPPDIFKRRSHSIPICLYGRKQQNWKDYKKNTRGRGNVLRTPDEIDTKYSTYIGLNWVSLAGWLY